MIRKFADSLLSMLLLAATVLAGCQTPPVVAPLPDLPEDAAVVRQENKQQALSEFEEARNKAEMHAARSAAENGDLAVARRQLEKLLARSPRHRPARRLLTDVLVATEQWEAAAEHLRQLIENEPADAASHHSLALVYEQQGRAEEALGHYRRAVELAPDSDLYTLSLEVAAETLGGATATAEAPTAAPTGDKF